MVWMVLPRPISSARITELLLVIGTPLTERGKYRHMLSLGGDNINDIATLFATQDLEVQQIAQYCRS